MNANLIAHIHTYCEWTKVGKPAAIVAIQERYIGEAWKVIESHDLKWHLEDLAEGWKTLWIYREPYMLEVIKKMPDKPKTPYDHWVLGKIFGYSDESIKTFILNKK